MTTQRTLILKSIDSYGNAKQQAITSANPAATDQQIDTFCRGINGLSKNTYDDTIRRDEVSINESLAE
jgi:hypothetical protein